MKIFSHDNLKFQIVSTFVVGFLIVFVVVYFFMFANTQVKLPKINGTIIPQAIAIADFSLLDNKGENFSNQNLLGKWHLLSYGYTNCPDVCPTTLSALARFMKINNGITKPQILFYSIDHQRDTPKHLNRYLPFFNQSFIGLTYQDSNVEKALPFEKSLGMISILTPVEDVREEQTYGSYKVSHGFKLYILNPEGKFQAVLSPLKKYPNISYFDSATIHKDFTAVKSYYEALQNANAKYQ